MAFLGKQLIRKLKQIKGEGGDRERERETEREREREREREVQMENMAETSMLREKKNC